MVVFTCNHCGESVKKPAVEKHYNFKCRGALKNVSCMDCQKDFHGDDYVAHIRCITEAEKYSSKDYIPKEPKNSGQKKQESWMNIIRSILETKEYNLSKQATATFQRLQTIDNVPRKKAKFENFVANCMRMRKDQAEEVWSVLEKELDKMKAAKAKLLQANGERKEPVNQQVTEKNEDKLEQQPENISVKQPESNSIKQPENNSVEQTEQNSVKQPEDNSVKQPENKRVKKPHSKKRKVDKEIQTTIEQDEAKEILQKITDIAEMDKSGGEPIKKKRKKSSKSEVKSENVNAEQEPTISTTTPDVFKWALIMQGTVRKHGGSVKLEKLKKKVQRNYLAKRNMLAFTEKQQRKFDKKFLKFMKKCNLKVENDVVSLIE